MAHELSFSETRMTPQVERAHKLFNRVLVSWAGDVLELRRRNLLHPTWDRAIPAHSTTVVPASQGDQTVQPMKDAA
ncbi:MAG: hypothetical protein RLY21_33 [Planctomycetota bacterium]